MCELKIDQGVARLFKIRGKQEGGWGLTWTQNVDSP